MDRQRNATIDVARGFTVFIMPAVHSAMIYGKRSVREGRLGKILGFLAEGPGAQLFLMLMGISVVQGRKKSVTAIFMRAAKLLFSGYLLNILRFYPLSGKRLPPGFFSDYGIPDNSSGRKQLLLSADILHSAALAYPLCAFVYRSKYYPVFGACLGLLIPFISPCLWRVKTNNKLPGIPLNLFCGEPPQAFFPFFPWAAYSLTGLAAGRFLKQRDSAGIYYGIGSAGIMLMAAGKLLSGKEPAELKTNFYRLGPGGTLFHTGIALVWLCLCKISIRWIKDTYFLQLLSWLSRHITTVYFIQWVIIFRLVPVLGYRRSGLRKTLLSIIVITGLTFYTARVFLKYTAVLSRKNTLDKA